jgi:chromosome segregation ATPase
MKWFNKLKLRKGGALKGDGDMKIQSLDGEIKDLLYDLDISNKAIEEGLIRSQKKSIRIRRLRKSVREKTDEIDILERTIDYLRTTEKDLNSMLDRANRDISVLKKESVGQECSICYNLQTKLKCGHDFHTTCIEKWNEICQKNGRELNCPICRCEQE